ncbi:LOW QUALITY PROTEIN: Protein FAR1-RELATED SEQUENCE 5 [Frankliniella fusca]|uniref:Protein FAR1-RELATED SEQUENCE 5 n=1 Tax=Frankliniella fusca TaxID=407009 RepID=A0AAE1HGZ7_9NEOP|nr:LOW QUALITY PROTEIN: Protein FAR1-RELATED SEQUENCE 5 [Frankliniella fusca]
MAMQDVPPGLAKGSSFSTYKELEPVLQELKYFAACALHKVLHETCGNSFKMNCKARLRIRVDESCMRLTITEMDLEQNHSRDPADAAHYPQNRQLTSEEGTHVKSLMDLEVRPVVLQSIIRTSTSKLTILQDMRNLQQRLSKRISKKNSASEVEKLRKELEDTRANDPNCTLVIGREGDDVAFIFWASSEMKSDFEAFPEVISLDSTYHTNNAEMPLTLFLCQNQHGNGRLAGTCLRKDEKKDILRESIDCFAQCYSSSVHKISSFFVDKSMNEVSRIWEILPNVDIHLCRFHCDQTFKKETQQEGENKIPVRSICKAMLYTESQDEYDHHFSELTKICSENFKKYFLKNWHNSRVVWKGHERLQGITYGLTTTNPNESMHGKLKKLLNRKRTITQCFSKLRLFHTHFNVQAAHKDFESRCKVKYVTNSSDPAIQDIATVCYPFAAKLIIYQLRSSYEMEALPAGFSIDCNKCSCAFYRSRKFPCSHMFFSRRKNESTLFSVDDVPVKWRIASNRQITSDQAEVKNVDDDFSEQPPFHPPPVLKPSVPVKVGGKPLTKAQKYTQFLKQCEALGRVASLCGGAQFVLKCNVIQSILDHWENNVEVCVTPLGSSSSGYLALLCLILLQEFQGGTTNIRFVFTVTGKQGYLVPERPSVIVQQVSSVSSVTTGHESNNENERPHIGNTEDHTSNTSPEKGIHNEDIAITANDTEAHTSNTFPEKENEDSFAEIFLENTNSNKASGIVETPLSALNEEDHENLKLPTAKRVAGQPRMGLKRNFTKSNKPWTIPKGDFITDRDKRRTKEEQETADSDDTHYTDDVAAADVTKTVPDNSTTQYAVVSYLVVTVSESFIM